MPTLEKEMNRVEIQTAGRVLMPEELDLRTLWIGLVYLTAEQLSHPTKGGVEAMALSVPRGK